MTALPHRTTFQRFIHLTGIGFLILMIAMINILPAAAQDERKVQVIEGHLALGENHLYLLLNLKQDDNLSIYVESLSGNLDPTIALAIPALTPMNERFIL